MSFHRKPTLPFTWNWIAAHGSPSWKAFWGVFCWSRRSLLSGFPHFQLMVSWRKEMDDVSAPCSLWWRKRTWDLADGCRMVSAHLDANILSTAQRKGCDPFGTVCWGLDSSSIIYWLCNHGWLSKHEMRKKVSKKKDIWTDSHNLNSEQKYWE